MLMLAETLPQQPTRAISLDRAPDFFARDHPEFWPGTFRQSLPVGDQTTQNKSLTLLPDARKFSALLNAPGAIQAQTFRRFSGGRHTKSNRSQTLAAVATAIGEGGLAALGRITVKKSVLAFAADL